MTIDIPELDDKTYDDLFEEAQNRLPAYADQWSDYNPADPGITILELLAYLSDTHMYQLDQVTDEHREKYLKLMGQTPTAPDPAETKLSLSLPDRAHSATVPEGTKLTVVDESDTLTIFETTDEVVLTDASIEKVITIHGEGRTDNTQANTKEGMFYRAFGDRAEPDSALYLGFRGDPFEPNDSLTLAVDFHEEGLPEPAEHGNEDPEFFPSVNVDWEYCVDYEESRYDDAWQPMPMVRDGTYAFYRNGHVSLDKPELWDPDDFDNDEHGVVGQDPGLLWLRCRVDNGGYEIPPQLNAVKLNVVTAEHRSTVENETLSRVDPKSDLASLTEQTYEFENAPVLEAEITVDGERWEEVEDFDASGPIDPHYVLDREAGTVSFGDGINGRMPEPTATVKAPEYVFGGGRDGNVPATANWHFFDREQDVGNGLSLADLSISAEQPGMGGTDAETLEDAFQRTKRDLRRTYRAVTMEDYKTVAESTPGLRFGRATVLVEEREMPSVADNPAEVTVVVVPYAPLSQPRPEPSDGFLDAVQRHIDKHRLITDRVSVEPPDYVDLSFEIDLQTSTWIPESRVTGVIENTIREYINPIHGFEGDGWPFGRPLYSDDLVGLLEDIEFIDHVRYLSIDALGAARVDGDQNVLIDESTLFALDDVQTDVRTITTNTDEGGS